MLHCYSVREFMAFTSDILVEKTASGQRQSVKEQGTGSTITTLSPHCLYTVYLALPLLAYPNTHCVLYNYSAVYLALPSLAYP